jgi:hypothetical protein
LVVKVYIPEGINRENLVLMFFLENSQKERFGDAMIGIIDIIPTKEQLEIIEASFD